MSMRVYELAKKLGLENKTLLSELKKMGVSVSSHSSALDDDPRSNGAVVRWRLCWCRAARSKWVMSTWLEHSAGGCGR
ncbi:MAG: hypothetical protein HP494_13375 [Nitrospira sp.]|nr:hypothetical protein [Nitrospira sp.]